MAVYYQDKVEEAIRALIEFYACNTNKECLDNTPRRFIDAFAEMVGGYKLVPESILSKVFNAKDQDHDTFDQVILVDNMPFTSLCAHHLLPFRGLAHVAYIPDKFYVGLSKIPRLLECYARRLQMQETLGSQIADAIVALLAPLAVAVVIESDHSCMQCRGVKSSGSMVTSVLRGAFRTDASAREELFLLLGRDRDRDRK